MLSVGFFATSIKRRSAENFASLKRFALYWRKLVIQNQGFRSLSQVLTPFLFVSILSAGK
jgi:hypothetical protein